MVNETFPQPLVCRHVISVFASKTMSLNAEHAVTITVVILSSLSDCRDTMLASSACSIPHNILICTSSSFPPRPSTLRVGEVPFFSPFLLLLLELYRVVRDGCISEEAFLGHTYYRCGKHVEQQWREHAPLPETLPHVERIPTLSITQRMLACRRGIGV